LTLSPVQIDSIWVGRPDRHTSTIFRDKRVFGLDYIPDSILHRDEQIRRLRSNLDDIERGVKPKNSLVIGTFGTGKTVSVCSVCRSLPSTPVVAYLNCAEQNTRIKILREILGKLKNEDVRPGFPSDFYLRWFKEQAGRHRFVILILDEVDKFVEHKDSEYEDLFYTLSRTVDNVVVIMLTNRTNFEENFLAELDSRVRDTFYFERIEFPDYYANELMDILRDRVQIGLNSGTYDEGTIATISKISYDNGLRARGIVKLTRMAGEIAESKGHSRIENEDIRQAADRWIEVHELDLIRRLPPPVRALLAYIHVNSPFASTAYEYYKEFAIRNGIGQSRAQFQVYLTELDTLGLIDKDKHGRGRGKGADMRLTVKPEIETIVTRSLESEPASFALGTHPPKTESVTEKTQL